MKADQRNDQISKIVKWYIKSKTMPGAVVCISKQNEIIFHKAFGGYCYSPENNPKVTTDTFFDIDSITELFTALVTLEKINAGLIDKNSTIGDFVPNAREASITIEELLNHTSGLQSEMNIVLEQDIASTEDSLFNTASQNRGQYNQASINYFLLGRILEILHDEQETLDDFLLEFISSKTPYASDITYFPEAQTSTPTVIRKGELIKGVVYRDSARMLGEVCGHAGLFCTAENLLKFINTVLPRYSNGYFGQVQGNQNAGHDLAWMKFCPWMGNWRQSAMGYYGYTGCFLVVNPSTEHTVVLLTNRTFPDRDPIKEDASFNLISEIINAL